MLVINFCMDFLSAYITARLMHLKIKAKRITLSAFLGALYSLFSVMFMTNGAFSFLLSLTMAFLMTAVAHGKQKTTELLKNTGVFYAVNFALGGGITALCNVLNIWKNSRNIVINGTFDVLYGDLPFGLLIILALICGAFSFVSGRLVKKKASQKECFLKVTINGKTESMPALVDSGNLLKEPISGKPVVVAAFEGLRKIIPIELFDLFKNKTVNSVEKYGYTAKIRLIPTSTVSDKGILFAIMPDSLFIDEKQIDAYLAITADTNNFGGFSAIVPKEIA